MGVSQHLIMLLKQLYKNGLTTVQVNNTYLDCFKVRARVHQRSMLTPLLFNIHSEYIMQKVFDDWDRGIQVKLVKSETFDRLKRRIQTNNAKT